MRYLFFILAFLIPDYLFGESIPCDLKWPQSCGVLKPDPGGFPTFKMPTPSNTEVKLSDLISLKEIPVILCRAQELSSDAAAVQLINEKLSRYSYLKDYNINAAIVPTMVTAKYKSGVIVSIGAGNRYICFNDKADKILYVHK